MEHQGFSSPRQLKMFTDKTTSGVYSIEDSNMIK
jgi:hypothetical protein